MGRRRRHRVHRSSWSGVSGVSGVFAALAVAAILVLAPSCGGGTDAADVPAVVDDVEDPIVVYSAIDSDTGAVATLEDLRGRPVILASWATWCVPCRKELPALERFHRTQDDDGVQVVIVNLDSAGNDRAVAEFVEQFDLTMTRWRDADDEFTRVFQGLGIPMSVMLDHAGRVVERWYGALDPDDQRVRGRIDEVLAATPGRA